jgi:hypothetical protein
MADLYRGRADECRQQAERSIHASDKESWLRIAEEWMKLVQSSEHPTDGAIEGLSRPYIVK